MLVDALAVTRERRAVYIEDTDLDAALNFASVLSIPFVIDELVPALAAAVDGGPASTAESDREQSPSPSPSSTPTS